MGDDAEVGELGGELPPVQAEGEADSEDGGIETPAGQQAEAGGDSENFQSGHCKDYYANRVGRVPYTESLRISVLAAVVVLANVVGNFSMSWGMKHRAVGEPLLTALMNPFVIAGIVLLIFWTLTRITLLSLADLSYVLPITSIGYVLSAVAGWLFLSEAISRERAWGIALITLGTVLVGRTAPKASS